MVYEHTEHFIDAISHDEVVHGKRSLLEKMPGDDWQKLSNLRLLLAYQFTRPGKKLLFMGTELAQRAEWNVDAGLDLDSEEPRVSSTKTFVAELCKIYRATPALWRADYDPAGFEWIDCTDRENCVISYVRSAGESLALVILNFTPVPREGYRIGVPFVGQYVEIFSSDDPRFGGSGVQQTGSLHSEPVPWHGRAQSIRLRVPPLGAAIFRIEPRAAADNPF